MEDNLQFLLDGDKNIDNAEITEYYEKGKVKGLCLTLSVGPSDEELDELILKNNGVFNQGPVYREILITEKDLRKVLDLMKKY